MSTARFFGPDPANFRLRATLATLQRRVNVACARELSVETGQRLQEAIASLTDQLALGPAPEVRKCPNCGSVGMRAATICGNCWTHLEPSGQR